MTKDNETILPKNSKLTGDMLLEADGDETIALLNELHKLLGAYDKETRQRVMSALGVAYGMDFSRPVQAPEDEY